MGPTLKNLPKTSGCVLYPARNSKVPISFGSTSSTSTVRRRTKCARTWSISTIISAIRRDRSYPSIRAIVRPEHALLPPMNLPEAIPSEPLAVNLGMGLATAQVEEVTVEVMVDRRSKLDSPEAVGILDLVAGIIVVEEAEGPSYPTKVGLLLAMMTLILQPTSTSSKKKIKIFPQNISFALLFPRTALFFSVGVRGTCHITGIWMLRKKMITNVCFFLSTQSHAVPISLNLIDSIIVFFFNNFFSFPVPFFKL